MYSMLKMSLLLLLLFPLLLHAASSNELGIYVWKPDGAPCAKPGRVPADAVLLFTSADVERLDWERQAFVLNRTATGKLLSNAAELEKEGGDEFVPRGLFPESEGKSFAAVLNGRILVAGMVAGMETLQHPPDCPLLYPGLPMTDRGSLVLGIGLPRKEDVLREDFFKVLIEEGPSSCFSPVLPAEIRQAFGSR